MGREIKFRAWSDKLGKYYNQGAVYTLELLAQELNGGFLEAQGGSDVYVFEQYTGLKDINGKEIYEGDIICSKYHSGAYEVVFGDMEDSDNDGYFYLGWAAKSKDGDLYSLYDFTADEVVGNIHQVKELSPLIKDKEVRRALRYWAKVMEVETVEYDSYWHSFRRDNSTICFKDIDDVYFPLEDGKDYTITELCGEDEDNGE